MIKILKYKFFWLNILNTPFKLPRLFFYLGKVKHGVPYFLPKNFSFKILGLGWKTKWGSYRHEWNPMISIVLFNIQFCIYFGLKDDMSNMCYWETWLYYNYDTDNSYSKKNRLLQCKEKICNKWGNSIKGYTNYYNFILRKKYLKLCQDLYKK